MFFKQPIALLAGRCLLLVLAAAFCGPASASTAPDAALQRLLSSVNDAAVLLVDPDDNVVLDINADQTLIPASTAKLLLAWLVLGEFGSAHQIETTFHIQRRESTVNADVSTARLWVKASGDPYLTSEELPELARQLSVELRNEGIRQIHGFGVDESLFDVITEVPGGSFTRNPYDALPSAIAANFNTVVIQIENDKLIRGEPQTPVTSTTEQRAAELALFGNDSRSPDDMRERVNLGFSDQRISARYATELLSFFLQQQGINVVNESVEFGSVPVAQELLRYRSTHRLDNIAHNMLTYSTNFIANQLALVWVAALQNTPANFEHFSRMATQRLRQAFGWQSFSLLDGAGLSRNNRLSARQLVEVVDALKIYNNLLPQHRDGVRAKTGTLNGVSSLAGIIDSAALPDASPDARGFWRFAILVNDETINDPSWREAVLSRLIDKVHRVSMEN